MTREEALKHLDTILTEGEQVDALEMAIKALKEQRPNGEWEKKPEICYDYFYCSECGKACGSPYDFCPNCGADMRKEGENN